MEEVFRAFDTGMLSAGAGWSRPFRPFYLSMVFADQGGAGLQAFSPGMVFADQGGAGLQACGKAAKIRAALAAEVILPLRGTARMDFCFQLDRNLEQKPIMHSSSSLIGRLQWLKPIPSPALPQA